MLSTVVVDVTDDIVNDEVLAVNQYVVTNQNDIGAVDQSVDKSYLEFVLDEKSYGISNSWPASAG